VEVSYPPPHGIDTERTQTSMPPVGFEFTMSVLERAKTVRALDRATTAIGVHSFVCRKSLENNVALLSDRLQASTIVLSRFRRSKVH
jgi:hypothetical protein